VAERTHLSIGEVLNLLQEEFPDITISKIRFLESQGLLDPERTPSGYRKFYDGDIERLRWILRQQREHFLPLKVIKVRLERGELGEPPPGGKETVGNGAAGVAAAAAASASGDPAAAGDQEGALGPAGGDGDGGAGGGGQGGEPAGPAPAERPGHAAGQAANPLDAGPTSVSLSRDELVAASGLDGGDLDELERFGLIAGRSVGGEVSYDDAALVVARLAAGFLGYGVQARHLRMYKVAAEREAGFFEQVVMPLVKQRNPVARRQAVDTLRHLASLGQSLHAALLRDTLRQYTERG
jgi:DNA-binding transcriptional MerR regulator